MTTQKYHVKKSWNRPGWFTICYLNTVQTPTLLCEAPTEPTAHHIADILNGTDSLAQNGHNVGMLPSQFWGGEMLTSMTDEAIARTYQLLIEMGQNDAAQWLRQYALKIAQIDLEAQ